MSEDFQLHLLRLIAVVVADLMLFLFSTVAVEYYRDRLLSFRFPLLCLITVVVVDLSFVLFPTVAAEHYRDDR